MNDSPTAEDEFKELNEAYDVLSDANKRAQYDRFGTIPGAGSQGGPGYVDFEDIFGGFWRDGRHVLHLLRRRRPAEGEPSARKACDMGIGIDVTLEQVASGTKREVVYDRLCALSGLRRHGPRRGRPRRYSARNAAAAAAWSRCSAHSWETCSRPPHAARAMEPEAS